jgi:hypothetical protein
MVRQSIVDSIIEQMQKISSANGFYSEAGANVYEWMNKPLEKGQYPAIIVRDVSDETNDSGQLQHTLKVEIDIAVSSKSNTIWDMREVTSDVLKAFGSLEKVLNYQCKYLGSGFLVEHKDSVYGGVRCEFNITYFTSRWEQ